MTNEEYDDITQQLVELLETLESGDIETACEWLRIAIDRHGTRTHRDRSGAFRPGGSTADLRPAV